MWEQNPEKMSFQTFVTERLEDLTAKYNALVINAKRIFELPRQLTLNPTSLIHVSRAGVSGPVSESLEVQKIIDAIVDKMFSHLLEVGDITVAGLVVTVPANAKWVYEGIHYGTIADTNITETLCAADHLRKDILVANQSNQIVLIKGDESETIRIRPNVPIGSILVTEIDVDDTTIGTPTPPVTLQDLAYKLDKGAYTGNADTLDTRITALESIQDLSTGFIGNAYAIWTEVGLIYDVFYPDYYIEGVFYPAGTEQITLDAADSTDPRQDVIAVDATGPIKITGDASPDPVALSVDTKTQIYVSTVFIAAGATTPSNVDVEVAYDNNTEWNNAANFPSANPDATTAPFRGLKHFSSGAFTNGQYFRFLRLSPLIITDFDTIKFYVNLRATFSNSTKFTIRLYNGSTLISSIVSIDSGTYGYDRTVVNTYQAIIIPVTAFTLTNSIFDRIDIVMTGANTSGFYLDYFALFKGSGSNSPAQNAITSIATDSGVVNSTTANDLVTFKGAGGLVVSSVGKVITFTMPNEYNNLFTYASGAQTFVIPATLKITNVTLNDGRVLKKTIDWTRTAPAEITIDYALEADDTIYVTGLN